MMAFNDNIVDLAGMSPEQRAAQEEVNGMVRTARLHLRRRRRRLGICSREMFSRCSVAPTRRTTRVNRRRASAAKGGRGRCCARKAREAAAGRPEEERVMQ